MIEPTNLNDPYVIQLIDELAKRDDEIEHLKSIIDKAVAAIAEMEAQRNRHEEKEYACKKIDTR